jgi:hypothetical protein
MAPLFFFDLAPAGGQGGLPGGGRTCGVLAPRSRPRHGTRTDDGVRIRRPLYLLAGFLARQHGAVCNEPREARHPGHLPRSCALVLLAPSTVMSAAGTTVACRGGRKGGLGGNLEPGRVFRGRGGSGFPPSQFRIVPLLQFVRSGVGGILTSPSCLVEGVRSGSRRRNAATASVLVEGTPGRNRGVQRQ